MKAKFLFSAFFFFIFSSVYAQSDSAVQNRPLISAHVKDSIRQAMKDSIKMEKLKALAYFPLINAGVWSGVLPVEGIDEIPSPRRKYKLLFEFTQPSKDTTHKELNEGLVEIARVINLHIASGIPLDHLRPVVVAHGPSIVSLLNDDAFREKYKKGDNPNDKLIGELMKNGVKFIACGQAMKFQDVKKDQLHADVKVALTAQVVLSNYIGQGYVKYDIREEK